MTVTPSYVRRLHSINLRNVPPEILNPVLAFAAEDHRSMTGEILHILAEYVRVRGQAQESGKGKAQTF